MPKRQNNPFDVNFEIKCYCGIMYVEEMVF